MNFQRGVGEYEDVLEQIEELEREFRTLAGWRMFKMQRNLSKRGKLLNQMRDLSDYLSRHGMLCRDERGHHYLYRGGGKIYRNHVEKV